MAFKGLKRFFSIGNKKDKKKSRSGAIHHSTPPLQCIFETRPNTTTHPADDSAEVAANQLLRSSSARYAVVREYDYNTLPPLPHPINHILQTPASSTVSLSSASSSVTSTTRGSYTVTVHGRERLGHTEFPNANRDLNEDSRSNQLLGLRSDPSVASLLDMYDEHGRLPAHTFSNSPPKHGRAQAKRGGSTLRELLGNPSPSLASGSDGSSREGDISWAERFLAESESSASSSPSLASIVTPDFDASLNQTTVLHQYNDSFGTDASSMLVEVAGMSSTEVQASDMSHTPPRSLKGPSPYITLDPKTPQRASQVFGFLNQKKRQSRMLEDERPLAVVPDKSEPPSGEIHSTRPMTPTELKCQPKEPNDVHVLMDRGPTRVILTAPTPQYNKTTPRGPRGPRSHSRPTRQLSTRDAYTQLPTRRHLSRSNSVGSTPSNGDKKRPSILAVFEKENHLTARQEIPKTPVRTSSISRPYKRTPSVRAPASVSPAASVDLSFIGQQVMGDLRKQRARARDYERKGQGYI